MSVGEKEKRIRFLYRKLGANLHYKDLEFWIQSPEFQDKVCDMLDREESIDPSVVLAIMVSIRDKYREIQANSGNVDFNFNWARRAINKLSKELGVYEGPNRKWRGLPPGSNSEGS